ncbi:MAG: dihydroxyacetone kinase family protein [Bifidobacteriaceae bacterium]|jgi:dihydroxyacetone kinase|nr:dihydroxyacetone kinase family protein [Bifidobacteriaceae bacterium]
MTKVFDDPAAFGEDMLAGFVAAHGDLVRRVPGGVVRWPLAGAGKVAVVVGGGSGHYPAFVGLVGEGMADGAVVGDVFTSPSASHAISVAEAAHEGAGIVFSYGNYAGDVINFGQAQETLRGAGIPTQTVLVTDDMASGSPVAPELRRGIAGDFAVFKVLGAAAREGLDLVHVVEAGTRANAATRSFGVGLGGCTLPGSQAPLFTLPEGVMGVGLGIHGEPGIGEEPLVSAHALAGRLVSAVLGEFEHVPARVAVILNGLGRTKYEELFCLYRSIAPALEAAGSEIVQPEVGEFVTSLDMAGVSLTLMALDQDLERWWRAPVRTPAFIKPASDARASAEMRSSSVPGEAEPSARTLNPIPGPTVGSDGAPTAHGQVILGDGPSRCVVRAFEAVAVALADHAEDLGRLDAVAGDGDHGRGMVRGSRAALAAVRRSTGASSALMAAGQAWAAEAGGTSGALWGGGLEAFARELPERGPIELSHLARGAEAFKAKVQALGGAQVGDKTMVDALGPFCASLSGAWSRAETDGPGAWRDAAALARAAASATAQMKPKLGRARPLAELSVGTPDPGASSLALVVEVVGEELAKGRRG